METSTTAVAPPATVEPATKRWLRWSGILGRFATVQLVVQAVNALTGLLFVRLLSKHDYALFTIASSMQAMLNLLTDCGINAGLLSIGGKVWTNPDDLGRLVRTALHLRRQMSLGALLIVSPISLWLLLSNGASVIEAAALTAAVVGAVHFVTAAAVFGVVTKLHSRYSEIQRVELAGAFSRLVLALSAAAVFLNALAATAAASVSQVVQCFLVRRQSLRWIRLDHPDDPIFRGQLLAMVKSQAFYFAFYAIQGQLTVVLISLFGTTGQVADLGALSRLGIISAVFGGVFNHVITPAFARIQNRQHLWWTFIRALLMTLVFGLMLVAVGRVFAPQILWLFGKSYAHLTGEVVLMMASIALGLVLALVWGLNTARGWLHATWLMVPLTLAVQLVLARTLSLSTVRGVIVFSILTQVPNLVVSVFMCLRGIAQFHGPSKSQDAES
jgi:O-antigen/teichoic acid export membrane protein